MVDIVTQTMPAESDVHVARNFLTKILRSSMRKNRFKGRNESSCRPHSWHSAKSSESSNPNDSKSEPNPAPDPTWQTKCDPGSPTKEFTSCWGQTNLRQASCQFSSVRNMESVEPSSHAFSKEQPLTSKPNGGADHEVLESAISKPALPGNAFSGTADHGAPRGANPTEGVFYRGDLTVPSDCHRYLQIPIGNGGRVSPSVEEQSSSRLSSTARSNHRPVWHIPENKMSSSEAPPAPPLRSDSFTATRVHEKSLVGLFPEGHTVYPLQRPPCRAVDRQLEDVRHSYNSPPKKDYLEPYLPVEDYPNQLNPTKLFSLSSTDVRQGQNPFASEFQHQRQHSDDSPFSVYNNSTCSSKSQSVGSYYRSLQDLPNNVSNQNKTRTSTVFDPNHDGQAHFRYYCITAQQPYLESSSHCRMVDEQSSEMGKAQGATDRSFVGSQKVIKAKHPQLYLSLPENKRSNGYNKQSISPASAQAVSPISNNLISKHSSVERETQKKKDKPQPSRHIPNHQTEQNSMYTYQHDNPWISKQDLKICPHKTPLLHSLAQESKKMAENSITTASKGGSHESSDASSGKLGRRSDRYATTLRKEIQKKRAQLQKSRSAATLTCSTEVEEDSDIWKSNETSTSSSDGSFTNTYKDHLKEAQAKVLQATSFMRKDLELPGNEVVSAQLPKRPGQVTRIGGRKRFPMDKKIHSFSEPDKINEVGVEDKAGGSFADRYKFFEGSGKAVVQKPIPKQSLLGPTVDHSERKTGEAESIPRVLLKQSKSSHSDLNADEQQRLGTFAEYEATWNLQKKQVERRNTGRYHSAENILDSGLEESNSALCVHERSRSSPSADFYGQKLPLPPRKLPLDSPPEAKDQQEAHISSASEKEHNALNISKSQESITMSILDNSVEPLGYNQKSRSDTKQPAPITSQHLQVPMSEQLLPKNNGLIPQHKELETTCPIMASLEVRIQTFSPEPTQERLRLNTSEPLDGDMHAQVDEHKSERMLSPIPHNSAGSPIPPKQKADLTVTSASRTRSPSPQFFPQRLTDEPPANVYKKDPCSSKVEEPNTPGRKVPIQIVCTENGSERDIRNYLLHSESSEEPQTGQLKTLESSEQCHAPFIAYSNQIEEPILDPFKPMRSNGVSEHSEDDLKREELARDIMGKDRSLVDILDQRKMKTTMDLMEGIFPQGEQILEGAQQRRKAASKQTSPKNAQQRMEESLSSSVSLVSSSSYYSTSAPKAELLIKMKDMQEQDSEDELTTDLSSKKQELMDSLSKKLQVLREARESLQEDVQDNNALGEEVEATVQSVCRANELEKFRMFVGDLDKVVSLLLSLSGRLARVENALDNLEEGTSADEKQTLTEKRRLLIGQHEDAKELKENLDRRERVVYEILTGYFREEQLADYRHFVKMKSALIIEQRKLEDKIKLGEEQLKCLKESLPLEQRLLY
uniref:Protein Shroom2 isoform X3 n=1 Tax=Danio rerio TaxID=7955 RepID=E7F501_DANRE|nr:protein Shroom2-like isoform X1 [Danio rerio]|eukprot:XP_005172997.2 protein Shroom2-like isoform X1 [Danio rerio]